MAGHFFEVYNPFGKQGRNRSMRNVRDTKLPLIFPKKFMWGASTAPHQVEGSGGSSNWDNWERSHARLKQLKDEGKDPFDFICFDACQFDSHYGSDFALACDLGHNAVRLGVNWATVEPKPGLYDETVLELYRSKILAAHTYWLEPVVTLYHWTHPMWLEEMGGWKHFSTPARFEAFVKKVIEYIGDDVTYYCVLNEPNVYANFSYHYGMWPPQEAETWGYTRANDGLIESHSRAHDAIKAKYPLAKVGIAQSVGWNECEGTAEAKKEKDTWNTEFIDRTRDKLDFIGLNPYFHNKFFDDGTQKVGWEAHDACTDHPVVSDMGWGICPRAIYEVLKEYSAWYPDKPLLITEHGQAVRDRKDRRRAWFLWESLKWMHLALQEGVNLEGYLHWSFIDNFEWSSGFPMQFGLVHVDRKTMKRTPRASAYLLRDIIASGGLTEEVAHRYRKVIRHPHEK